FSLRAPIAWDGSWRFGSSSYSTADLAALLAPISKLKVSDVLYVPAAVVQSAGVLKSLVGAGVVRAYPAVSAVNPQPAQDEQVLCLVPSMVIRDTELASFFGNFAERMITDHYCSL